jgi:hypothetical protein
MRSCSTDTRSPRRPSSNLKNKSCTYHAYVGQSELAGCSLTSENRRRPWKGGSHPAQPSAFSL